MTGFEKLTIEELEAFIERNKKYPFLPMLADAQVELLRKRIEEKLAWAAKVKSGEAWQ